MHAVAAGTLDCGNMGVCGYNRSRSRVKFRAELNEASKYVIPSEVEESAFFDYSLVPSR